MHARLLWRLTCAITCVLGCCTELGPIDDGFAADAGTIQGGQPDDALLCEIRFGRSTSSEVERVLGLTDRRETAESTTLLYQYTTGLTLSLVFRDDIFVDAAVYNGTYPDCWAEAERAARGLVGEDGGLSD